MSRALFALALAVAALSVGRAARAEEPTAEQILEKARRASALGLVGAKADVSLVVDDGHEKKERHLTASAMTLVNGETRRIVRFLDPAEVRGVGFLVVEHAGQPPERMLYLPSQKRVRKVSGTAGSGSFLNTDFAYADLDLAGGTGDTSERLADETLDGNRCWVVATKPAQGAYARVVSDVDQKTGVTLRVTFEDADHKPVKKLEVTRVKQVEGKWYAFESVMETVGKGSKTTLSIAKLDAHAALDPNDFTEQALERP